VYKVTIAISGYGIIEKANATSVIEWIRSIPKPKGC
jgi:hypothetical protein